MGYFENTPANMWKVEAAKADFSREYKGEEEVHRALCEKLESLCNNVNSSNIVKKMASKLVDSISQNSQSLELQPGSHKNGAVINQTFNANDNARITSIIHNHNSREPIQTQNGKEKGSNHASKVDLDSDSDTQNVKTNPESFRELVFKAGYWLLKGELDLGVIADLNRLVDDFTPHDLGDWLDLVSYYLIKSEETNEIKDILKLSLSRIIYLLNDKYSGVIKDFFQNQDELAEEWLNIVNNKVDIPSGLPSSVKAIAQEIVDSAKEKGGMEARVLVCKKKMALLELGVEESVELQVLDIMDNILQNINSTITGSSELSYYRRFSFVLDALLRDTKLIPEDGEKVSQATKSVKNWNAAFCQDCDTKQEIFGRKIDLIITSIDMELSCSEWKKENASPSLVLSQQVKNVRSNKAVLKAIEKLPHDKDGKKERLFTLGMDWIGTIGYMFSVSQLDGAYIAQHVADLILPIKISDLDDFMNTLDTLYQWKHHHLQLEKIVEPAHYRQKRSETLAKFRTTQATARPRSPDTLFSPVKKQRSQKRIHNANSN